MPAAVFALVFALAVAGGGVYLSLGLGLVACPLCFYQRAFAFAVVGVLAAGLAVPKPDAGRLCILAVPPAVGGLGVAAFHVWLVTTGKLECPAGVEGVGPAPVQSLAGFVLVNLALGSGVVHEVSVNRKLRRAVLAAVVLGLASAGALTYPGVNPTPKMADKPPAPGEVIVTCRVPYRG